MMQKKIVLSVVAGAAVLGLATGAVAVTFNGDDTSETTVRATSTPSPSPSETAEEEPPESAETDATPAADGDEVENDGSDEGSSEAPALKKPGDLLVIPGAIGPVTVGMSKREALATGYFDADVASPADGCPAAPLRWKQDYKPALDVRTAGNGEVLSIGVFEAGPRTRSGFSVGSTYGQIRKVVDNAPQEAGYGQTGVTVYETRTAGWIGFLFDVPPDRLSDSSKVTFMEVTKGGEPSLIRDGC